MSKSKYEGGHRAGASGMLDRHPLVEAYDCHGTDESDAGVPRRIITLVPGWAFEDAAETEADDPDGRYALHSRGCGSVKEALEDLKYAKPCKCGRCMDGLKRAAGKEA